MNENNYCKKCNSDIPFRPCPVCNGDFEEPTIKASELREWCESRRYMYEDWSDGMQFLIEDLIAKFCGGDK